MIGRSNLQKAASASSLSLFLALTLLSGGALAQATTIPGVGGGIPPKVMIIFDTSTSMRNLPGTDIANTPSFPSLPVRGIQYAFDDYGAVDGGWDGGCDSRFCIAKRVLSNTLPTYTDSIQMGISSYYQYRTKYQQPNGTSSCQYDVIAGPGTNSTFADPSLTAWSTSRVPPTNVTVCDDIPANRYSFSNTGADGGLPVVCTAYRPMPDAGPWAITDTNCLNASNFTSTGVNNIYGGGGATVLTGNLWSKLPRGATCPTNASAQTWYYRNSGALVGGGTFAGPFGDNFIYAQTGANTFATSGNPLLAQCGNGLAACQITMYSSADPLRSAIGNETSTTSIFADAGSPLDAGTGLTGPFTFNTLGTTYAFNIVVDAGVACRWPTAAGGALSPIGSTVHVSSMAGFEPPIGAVKCSGVTAGTATLNPGCRVAAVAPTTTAQPGNWAPALPGTSYSWSVPGSYPSVCSDPGVGPTNVPYAAAANITATMPATVAPGSCANISGVTNTGTYAGTAFSASTPVCTAANPCDYAAGTTGMPIDDPGSPVYTALGSPAPMVLKTGFPLNTTVARARSGYGEACATTPITDIAPCSVAKPCAVLSAGVDGGGGAGPGDEYWYSSTIAAYAVDGGVVTSMTPVYQYASYAAGPTAVPLSEYGPEKTGAGCTATVTLTSGTVNSKTCSASRPCTLTSGADICQSISTGSVVACSTGSDSTQKRFCSYAVTTSRYSATPYGYCVYNIRQYAYVTPSCQYTIHQWNPNPPACTETRNICQYRVVEHRYTYPNPFTYCRAWATSYTYSGTSPLQYIYSWSSKGGEYLGSFSVSAPAGSVLAQRNWCDLGADRYPDYSTAPSCPPEINASNRAGFQITQPNAYSNCGTGGRVCRLRWRTGYDAGASGFWPYGRFEYANQATINSASPNFELYDPNVVRCMTPDHDGGAVATPDPARTLPAAAWAAHTIQTDDWCNGAGTNGAVMFRLLSDWYEPARSNGTPLATLPFAEFWTNQDSKTSGWSANSDGGASQLFVDVDLGTNNWPQIRKTLSPCVRPTDLMSPMSGGFCMADDDNCGPSGNERCQPPDAGMTDYTPLNGSLANAREYMRNQLSNDNLDWSCRDYFVVLVTDGLESTPANFSQAQLQATVSSLTTLSSGARTKPVKTFVIGFGAGLTAADGGSSSLDTIARTGQTAVLLVGSNVIYDMVNGHALSATNEGELTNVLGIVFSSITQGRFARSRPTITTDGDRIYQAYFERGATGTLDAGSPEWRGNVEAFAINSTGALIHKWDFNKKLDAMPYSARNLEAWLPVAGTAGTTNPQPFLSTNGTLASYIDPVAPYTTGRLAVAFARNDGLGTLAGETFTPILIPRKTRAGAFVFSNPVAVGVPGFTPSIYAGLSTEAALTSYATYKANNANRTTRVLVGSEDGLLHGIADKTGLCGVDETLNSCPNGTEAWGIVPSSIVAKLPGNRLGPQLLVDGTAAVADVCWPSVGTSAADCAAEDWKTIAIGSLRSGGQSVSATNTTVNNSEYYALDVTDAGAGIPAPMWRYDDRFDDTPMPGSDDDLGLTYSTPTIGRVMSGANARWVAFAGGGKCAAIGTPDAGTSHEGDGIYMLDAQTGRPNVGGIATKWEMPGDCINFVARPTTYRRQAKIDVESAYYANERGQLYGQRLWPSGSSAQWAPGMFYDAWTASSQPDSFGNARAPIYYVVKQNQGTFIAGQKRPTGCQMHLGSAGTFNALPTLAGTTTGGSCAAELGTRRPIYGRPRMGYGIDGARVKPNIYFGTGDSQALDNTTSRDYFFSVFDKNFTPGIFISDPTQRGETSFVYMFDPGEKVLGEPVFASGSVVIATYKPPTGGTCNNLGDSYLYAFDPRTGDPRPTLRDPSISVPTFASVVKLAGVGAISDPVVINGGIFYADGTGKVSRVEVRPAGFGGRVQGWRRVR